MRRRGGRSPSASFNRMHRVLAITTLLVLVLALALAMACRQRQQQQQQRATEPFEYAPASGLCTAGKPFFVIPGFLSEAECDALVAAATEQGLTVSEVGDTKSAIDKNVRRSTQAWLPPETVPAAAVLARKVERLAADMLAANPACFGGRAPTRAAGVLEDVQVVKYEAGGKYEPHHDSTDCGDDRDEPCAPGKQRVATVLVYLNDSRDGLEGGHTRFPELQADVSPERGCALVFWVSDPDTARVYRETLHGGDPVRKGEKWIATQWILAG